MEVTASLPSFRASGTDAQRGDGVFAKSLEALRLLNEAGYGKGEGLVLNLVHNPVGTFLPGDQASLERDYKRELQLRHGIVFDRLFTITNMPISRFLEHLERTGNLQRYMELLVSSFNPRAADGVMCRTYLSVGWDGTLYDCDFNQMLEMPVEPRGAADARRAARRRRRRPAARRDRPPLLRLHGRGGLVLRGRRRGVARLTMAAVLISSSRSARVAWPLMEKGSSTGLSEKRRMVPRLTRFRFTLPMRQFAKRRSVISA